MENIKCTLYIVLQLTRENLRFPKGRKLYRLGELIMQKALLIICVYFIVFVFLGILWYYPVMPFLYYNTLADSEMKLRMEGDLIEFYGIVNEIHQLAKKGTPLTAQEKVVLVFTPRAEYGFLLWPVVGILWGLWRGLSVRSRLRKRIPVYPTF